MHEKSNVAKVTIHLFLFLYITIRKKRKIDHGFFLFEAEQRSKKEKLEKRQAKRKQDLSSEEIIAIPSSSKTSTMDKNTV